MTQEDADPRVGLVNLADVMLVFACGLMLALVVNWDIELPSMTEIDETSMQEVDDVEEVVGEITSSTNTYLELGTVYQDPATGKLYVLNEVEEDAESESTATGEEEGATDATEAEAETSETESGSDESESDLSDGESL